MKMALGLIDLVNDALATLGEQPIVDIDAEHATSTTILVRCKYPLVQRALLMEADWNCARKTKKLHKLDVPNTNGYKHTYQLPKDPECLQVQQISFDGERYVDVSNYYNWHKGPRELDFDVDGDTLLANADQVWIKYTALIDPGFFDPLLATAFSARLAAELSYAIPASASLGQYLEQVANKKLKKAVCRNALNRNIARPEGEVIGIRWAGEVDKHLRVDMSEEME